jgi:hypothetical protein
MSHRSIQLVATLTLITSAVTARAQITDPNKLISPPPHTTQPTAREREQDLQWLWAFAASEKKSALLADSRFSALLHDELRAPQAFWSTPGSPLADAARAFLAGPGSVASVDNRHLTVSGCIVDPAPDADTIPCAQRGLLWIDLGERTPLVVFAALRWNEQGRGLGERSTPYTLWLFSNRPLDAPPLSAALRHGLSAWIAAAPCVSGAVTSVINVDPSGVPHVNGTLAIALPTASCTTANEVQK